MRRILSAVLGLFLGVALSVSVTNSVYAKEKKPKAASTKEDRLSGTIHMVNKDTKTITVRKGNLQRQVVYDDNTKVTYRNKPGSWDDVKEGRRVIVLGKFNDKTQLMASRIDVREGK
jgi:ABC-type antimicrobial peptide transport system permease subunit